MYSITFKQGNNNLAYNFLNDRLEKVSNNQYQRYHSYVAMSADLPRAIELAGDDMILDVREF